MKQDTPLLIALLMISVALWFNVIAARQCSAVYGLPESQPQQADAAHNHQSPEPAAIAGPGPADSLNEYPSKNGCFRGPFGIPADGWVAFFTLVLTCATGALWLVTRQTLTHAQESSERQLRAYVSLEPNKFGGFAVGSRPAITFNVKNHGQTPAMDVTTFFMMAVIPEPLPDGFGFAAPDRVIGTKYSLFPDAVTESRQFCPFHLTQQEITDVSSGDKRFHCWGHLKYTDAFGVSRTTIFSASAGGSEFAAAMNAHNAGLSTEKLPWGWNFGTGHNYAT